MGKVESDGTADRGRCVVVAAMWFDVGWRWDRCASRLSFSREKEHDCMGTDPHMLNMTRLVPASFFFLFGSRRMVHS